MENMDDLKAALKILWDGARKDPINGAVLPLIGVAILLWLWCLGWLTWDVIHVLVCHDLC